MYRSEGSVFTSNWRLTGEQGASILCRLWRIHMETAAFTKVRQHDSCPMTQVGGRGGLRKLSGSCGAGARRPQTQLRHSQPHFSLSIRTVYVSSSFTYTERFMAAGSPLIPLHSRLTKRASAQAKTCTGENVSGD